MATKAPTTAPFLSVGAVIIVGSDSVKYRASGFLIRTPNYNRQDILLGAGHNLSHLTDKGAHVEARMYKDRDINSVAQRGNDTFRYAVAATGLPQDFGVAVLAEPAKAPALTLVTPPDASQIDVGVAGAIDAEMAKGDYGIWLASTRMTTHGPVSYSDPGVTSPGMSGGPVFPDGTTDRAIALVHGNGTIDIGKGPVPKDLYVTMTATNIAKIEQLIATALAG